MAEWLGTGLQNRLQQFESAWYLTKIKHHRKCGAFFNGPLRIANGQLLNCNYFCKATFDVSGVLYR